MAQHILFIQGAGKGAYEDDKKLAESIKNALGSEYAVHYPAMPDEENAPYEQWKDKIEEELTALDGPILLVGHSVGASVLVRFMSETKMEKPFAGVFLIAGPFWGGDGWLYEGYEELELHQDLVAKLPKGVSIFLYHCRDDEVVPFDHLSLFSQALPQATVRVLEKGGHQLNNDLSVVAKDIRFISYNPRNMA